MTPTLRWQYGEQPKVLPQGNNVQQWDVEFVKDRDISMILFCDTPL